MTNNIAPVETAESIETYLAAAKEFQAQGQDDLAIEKYLQALEIAPQSYSALNQLGKIYESRQQFEQAIERYQQAIALKPKDSLTHVRLGRALVGNNSIPEAVAAYKKAISLDRNSAAWIYHGYGDASIKNGLVKHAISAYRQALQQNPVHPAEIQRKIDAAQNIKQENPIRKIALQIKQEAPYTGGPIQHFEKVGRETIITLLQNGLRPDHKILDFGCGAIRLGYWLIRLVDRGNYYGIEPDISMIDTGKKYSLEEELVQTKQPKFSTNGKCDFSVFGVEFDFVVARSIFTHTTPAMLRRTLKSFQENSTPNGVMLASYWPLEYSKPGEIGEELPLTDDRFIPVIKYELKTLQAWSAEFGLKVSEYRVNPLINEQVWLKFENL